MRARPAGISDDDIRAALSRGWNIQADDLAYSPVGAGGYHWIATGSNSERYFVTVDDLNSKPWLGSDRETVFAALAGCYETAWRLRNVAGLEFVIAPVRATIARLTDRFSLAVFPYADGRGIGHFDTPPEASAEIVTLLSRLHAAGEVGRDLAPTRRLEIPARAQLDAALDDVTQPWSSGPHGVEARAWLAANKEGVERGLRAYDLLVEHVSAATPLVITHGEPHAGNFMRVNGKLALVDWDTVAFAPPERDLWLCSRGSATAGELYTQITARPVDPAALRLFALGWELTDIALYTAELRNDHVDSEDTRRAMTVLRHMDVSRLG